MSCRISGWADYCPAFSLMPKHAWHRHRLMRHLPRAGFPCPNPTTPGSLMEFSASKPMKCPRFPRRALMLAVAGLTLGIAACSSGSSGTATTSGASAAPELSSINVGVLPSADSVTVRIAQDKGFFKQQGLNVKVVTETTTNQGTQGLLSHTMDFTTENYVGMFAQQKSVKGLNLRIVADNSQASPDGYVLLVAKNSKLTSVSQLKGKRVAFPAPGF